MKILIRKMIEDIKIETNEYNFSFLNVSDEELENVKKMLPPPSKSISFIINARAAVANALRRTAISEVKTKALDYDPLSLNTNEEYIIPDQLYDRISLIPLFQDCPEDAVFSLDIKNDNPNMEKLRVLSDHLKGEKKYFNPQFCLAELHQNKYLKIPYIKVVTGYGWQHVKFSLTKNIEYKVLDFKEAKFINSRNNIQNKIISSDDYEKVKNKIITAEPLPSNITDEYVNNLYEGSIKTYNSTEVYPQRFFLKFTFYNVEPKKGMQMICDSLIERLNLILEEAQKPESLVIKITKKDDLLHFYILGETYTIGFLLSTLINKIPDIGLINVKSEHVLNRSIILNVKHHDALNLIIKSIKDNLEEIKKIREFFAD